jgi:uncharacterized protein YjbI with pentapeptide repeats
MQGKIALLCLSGLLVSLALLPGGEAVARQATGFAPLERQKLEAEIAKLRRDADKIDHEEGLVGDVVDLAPLITALVALGGLIATFWKQISENSRQRQLDREEKARGREQRFDEQFQQMAENLSSANGEVRAAAAASIEIFMRPEYEAFHRRLFLLLLGALRFPRGDIGDKLLVRTFQAVAPEQIAAMRKNGSQAAIDLSNCHLDYLRLSGVDLTGVDMAFASLHGADLSRSRLWRARGREVDLSGARLSECDLGEARLVEAKLVKANLSKADLVSAKLQRVDATGASFRGARLQEVQLDGAVLRGALFEGANLNNAFFRGASFDEGSLQSVAHGAIDWREANWDPEVLAALEAISGGGVDGAEGAGK